MWFKTSYCNSAEKLGCHGCDDGRNYKVSKIEYWTKSQMCSEASFVWTNRARLLPIFIQWKPESNFQRRPREIYWWETFEIWNIQYVLIMECFLVCFFKEISFGFKHKSDFKKRAELDFSKCCQKIFEQHCLCLFNLWSFERNLHFNWKSECWSDQICPSPNNELEWECFFQSFRQDFNFQETSDKLSEANFRNYIYFSACFQDIE